LPFTYLGLPVGTTKQSIQDFLPLVQRVERKLISTAAFLSQAGKLEMVNSVLSSTMVYHCCTLKLHKGVIKQLDKYRKHCLWKGSNLNAKQPSKAAWPSVCLPKSEGGLGVINLEIHNNSLLLKFLNKFYTKADIPWVHLVWNNYYSNGRLPCQQRRGSFWWRDIVKLTTLFKSLASATAHDGSSILFWQDKWNDHVLQHDFPELFSFATNPVATVKTVLNSQQLENNFHLPLSSEAHHQFLALQERINDLIQPDGSDRWTYIWGNSNFSASKAYKALIGHRSIHPAFKWIWSSKCQMKHKFFCWLLLRDRISTRDFLQRRSMELDSYTCEMCILQRSETCAHLFFRCNFTKACWASIGITVPTTRLVTSIINRIRRLLNLPFFMEIIILMAWSIWNTRNDWIFSELDPSVQRCRDKFVREFSLLLLRAKPASIPALQSWLAAL
jgi:hypothetical protein